MDYRNIMVQGTASSVGKSVITAGLCRIFKEDGYKVAPFKSQNMSLNSFITKDGGEMGRAQVVQAEAAGIEPRVEMNPILMKPSADTKAQIIIKGKVYNDMSAMEYHTFKPELKKMIKEAYDELNQDVDIVVIEGAGSPAEINLREHDIVNMGMAELVDAPVILVVDIDLGGVFASIAGTLMLLEESERARVKGVIINKFRGDVAILEPGLRMIEDIIKIPVLGVIPYMRLAIDDEDSIGQEYKEARELKENMIQIKIILLPYMSNFTDFNVLFHLEGVHTIYVKRKEELDTGDIIIIPGSKQTINDLNYLRDAGFEEAIFNAHGRGAYIFGICGGFQMLGEKIINKDQIEGEIEEVRGLGLLQMETIFQKEKVTTQVKGTVVSDEGVFLGMKGMALEGYEIHMGVPFFVGEDTVPFLEIEGEKGTGLRNKEGNVYGTYMYGVFDTLDFTLKLMENIGREKAKQLNVSPKDSITDYKAFKEQEYDKLAKLLRDNLDMDEIYRIVNGR